jgi:hypothetical protein
VQSELFVTFSGSVEQKVSPFRGAYQKVHQEPIRNTLFYIAITIKTSSRNTVLYAGNLSEFKNIGFVF